jgi:hypothetical protein
VKAKQKRADSRAADLAATIKALQEAGKTSLRAIAAGLNEQGITASRGGEWSALQVVDARAGQHRQLKTENG